jgi:hypothetical protein
MPKPPESRTRNPDGKGHATVDAGSAAAEQALTAAALPMK